jgi:DnaJ-domain-containing protein 1
MDFVRPRISPPDPGLWWVVLECHPKAPAAEVGKAFKEKMKECHPDGVAGLAPEIRKLANDMAQKLNTAMRDFEAANT